MPATGQLKTLDVDNGLAMEDWRASGLGPCAAMYFERQVLGEYPHSEEVRAYVDRERGLDLSISQEVILSKYTRSVPPRLSPKGVYGCE